MNNLRASSSNAAVVRQFYCKQCYLKSAAERQKVPGCSFERQKVPYQCSWETRGSRVQLWETRQCQLSRQKLVSRSPVHNLHPRPPSPSWPDHNCVQFQRQWTIFFRNSGLLGYRKNGWWSNANQKQNCRYWEFSSINIHQTVGMHFLIICGNWDVIHTQV